MIFNAYSDTDKSIFDISIKSCGHIFAHKGRKISRPNGRDDWLLFYIVKGTERFFLDGEFDANEGSFLIYEPHQPQEHINVSEPNGEIYYIHFTANKNFKLPYFDTYKVYNSKPSTLICDIFEIILSELFEKQHCYENICVSKLYEIFSLLSRSLKKQSNKQNPYYDKISYVLQKIGREYEKNYTLDEYAAMCNMSKFHFLRIFKNITGTSPIEYKNRIRIDHAKEMLESTLLPVSEICSKLGFTSPSYFCDAFKTKTGVSPAMYRKLNS